MILYNITGRDKARRRQSLLFLLRLGIGWICGMGLSVTLLAGLFSTHIYAVSSLFLGLVAASIPLVAAEEKKTLGACRPWHILFFFAGAAAVVALSLLHFSVPTEALDAPSALYVFVSGALAISAMVLPGISGSTLLLAFGLYVPIITAMKRFLRLIFRCSRSCSCSASECLRAFSARSGGYTISSAGTAAQRCARSSG